MRLAYLLSVAVLVGLAASLASCGGDEKAPQRTESPIATAISTPDEDGLRPTDENSPEAEAVRLIWRWRAHTVIPIVILSTEELENDGTYATVRITISQRPGPDSPWVEQYKDMIFVLDDDSVWKSYRRDDVWHDTEAERARQEAESDAKVLEALGKVQVVFPQTYGLKVNTTLSASSYTVFQAIPLRLTNQSNQELGVVIKAKLQFEDGAVFEAEIIGAPTIDAGEVIEEEYTILKIEQGIDQKYQPDTYTDEGGIPAKIISWWVQSGALKGEEHQVAAP